MILLNPAQPNGGRKVVRGIHPPPDYTVSIHGHLADTGLDNLVVWDRRKAGFPGSNDKSRSGSGRVKHGRIG